MRFYKNQVKIGEQILTVVTINQEDGEEIKVVEKARPAQIHHIQILDRSGSMGPHIHTLVNQVQKTLELIDENDLVSIVWFSSPGQYKTLVRGAKKSPELISLLDSLRTTYGTTCFSDPVKEVKTIIEDLLPLCENVSVTLFTDGISVTPWSQEEEEQKTCELVKTFKDKVLSFNTVGYGNSYHTDFLKNLSSLSEFGIFTHSSEIEQYYDIFKTNFERISENKIERVHIEYGLDIEGIYLNRKFTKMERLEMYLSRLDRNKNQFFLVGKTADFKFIYNDKEIDTRNIKEETAEPTIRNFMYAYAYNLYYCNKHRESLEVLATLRDKALLDSHMNAFTYDERACHQSLLEKAVFNTSGRLSEGEAKVNYLPPKDAFCVYDVLNMLAKENAFYLPYHKEADEYERIGKKTVDNFNLFEKSKDPVLAPFSEFVFNKERVNLSIRMCIEGTVKLNPIEARNVGLPEKIDSFVWKNHTFIKNGILNIKRCVVLLPETLYTEIQSKKKICEVISGDEELITKVSKEQGKQYVLVKMFFTRLPILNASYNEDISAEKIFKMCSKMLSLECKQKYLNHYWKEFESSATASQMKIGVFEGKSADQIRVLENHGIDKTGAYKGVDNQTPKKEDCDYYETREFEFVFKGISSLPSVKEVSEKVASKKMTISVSKMNEAHMEIIQKARKDGIDLGSATVQTRDWLIQERMNVKSELFSIRANLCAIKMAKLLNGDSFEGFELDNKKNLCYTKGDETLYLKTAKVKEYY